MKKQLATLILTCALILGGFVVAAQPALASTSSAKKNVCSGLNQVVGKTNCGKKGAGESQLNNIIIKIVRWFSIIVGVIAVIMLIVSGLKFITSGGEANSVASARKGIIFAVVGLIVVALAQFIVHFVLNNVT